VTLLLGHVAEQTIAAYKPAENLPDRRRGRETEFGPL